jgi:hypothetical protein
MPGFSGRGARDFDFAVGPVAGIRWWQLPDGATSLQHAAGWTLEDQVDALAETGAHLQGSLETWEPGINDAECYGPLRHTADQIPAELDCGCVSPETRVLTADLQWVPAGDLITDERLVAFDEYPAIRGYRMPQGRKYQEALVASTERGKLPCYDLQFEDGTAVRVSADHRWLAYGGDKAAHWVRTDELRAGELRVSRVVKPLSLWETDTSHEAGYLAAAFDGEGCLFQGGARYQFRLDFSQVENPMLAEVERCLKELGFQARHQVAPRGYNKPLRVDGTPRQDMHRLTIAARPELMRFLGSVRPVRLLPKFQPSHLGRLNMANRVRLLSKTFVGEQEVVKLGTTSGTYFAEGLASHNCGYWAYWTPGGQFPAGCRGPGWDVVGVVEGSGQTLIGEEGFRCARARIAALHLSTDLVSRDPDGPGYDYVSECWRTAVEQALIVRYGVPVYATVGALLEKHPPTPGYGPPRDARAWQVPAAAGSPGGVTSVRGSGGLLGGRGASVAATMAYAKASGLAGLRPSPGAPPAPDPGWRPVTLAGVRPGHAPDPPTPVAAPAAAPDMTPLDALAYLDARRRDFDQEDSR